MDVQWQAEALCQRHNWLLDESSDQWCPIMGQVKQRTTPMRAKPVPFSLKQGYT
jgi:hypothetical protein